MKLAIVTDAWLPQVNGVVRTLGCTIDALRKQGHGVEVIAPDRFRTVPCPSYPEIRLAVLPGRQMRGLLDKLDPDSIHIATEGPLGLAARAWCLRRGREFTTAYHTQFPEYVRARVPVPLSVSYAFLRRFHSKASCTMVATRSMRLQLEMRGFRNLAMWSRGVDTELFRPRSKSFLDLPRPIWLYFGRVAVEKGVEDFLRLGLPGTKVVVGDGPSLADFRARYPRAVFAGFRHGEDLASHVAAADVFVFPSRTDTFGLVLLEAMACGVPVAAYPVTGPKDVVVDGVTGSLNGDLKSAALQALRMSPEACRTYALGYSWDAATRQFERNLAVRVPSGRPSAAKVGRSVYRAG
jgi:glycosyltransferase involved in cell wall biosynthesis